MKDPVNKESFVCECVQSSGIKIRRKLKFQTRPAKILGQPDRVHDCQTVV